MSSIGTVPSPALPPPEQIRFVNNEGQPPPKRRRINAACRTCRKRKTRCDGKRPLCSTCTENGHECLGYADAADGASSTTTGTFDDRRNDSNRDLGLENEDVEEDERVESGGYLGHGKAMDTNRAQPRVSTFRDDSPTGPGHLHGVYKEQQPDYGVHRDTAVNSDDDPLVKSTPTQSESHRVPYFRYFGPTAIVPGFKQMVVSVREHRRSTGAGSAVAMSPRSGGGGSVYGESHSQAASESRPSVEMPVYDPADPSPVNRLTIHLVETFFAHLGCNYPFLQQKSFLQRVEDKSVEVILVDAVCALAARFSDHPLLTESHGPSYPKSDYGQTFAQRAKAAVVDTFPCPTVGAVQACLLLAYESFGSNQDSALWMFLGCAIRMAVDLGLQKLDGVKHQGPKDPGYHGSSIDSDPSDSQTTITIQEKKEVEQERIDTLWAVFMLDRVISSGTGRPATLRDDDFELTFPSVTCNAKADWPDPFPSLIQVIHLYGRISDLLNNIRDIDDVTPKKIEGLSIMEKDLTQFYQRLDPKLTFNAANFQHYCKSGEGTNFILVHFWFHTLIMLVHQPTLMHSFEGQIHQLLPNSRELSMSSAKTIADILSFAELIDARSFIGNPFTSQPMYIAACAFLKESAAHSSHPTSRDATPPRAGRHGANMNTTKVNGVQKQKHSLLASAANQNYQRCYKALEQLETYWAGTRYILVALDQKAKGIWDPETYTEQEYESTKIKHDIPSWRRKLSMTAPSPGPFADRRTPRMENYPGSPAIDPAQAIGWSLTGTTNSPSSNLTFMYQSMSGETLQTPSAPPPASGNMIYDPIRSSLPETTSASTNALNYPARYPLYEPPQRHHAQSMQPPAPKYTSFNTDSATTSDAEMLLGLQNSPYGQASAQMTSPSAAQQDTSGNMYGFPQSPNMMPGSSNNAGLGGVGDMMMESQEIDMSALGSDMMPWLEFLPQDVLNFFDNGNGSTMPGG